MPDHSPDNDEEELEYVSKSAVKREMTALQKLGATLVELSEGQLKQIPIDDEKLAAAIDQGRRIRSNSARKRQLQYIGKLMRRVDTAPIQRALDELHQQHQQATEAFHEIEALRDQLLAEGDSAIQLVIEKYPTADRQHLRQLIKQHQKEVSQQKPPAASRKLFRYLRELADS